MGVGDLRFYGPEWLFIDSLISGAYLLAAAIVLYLLYRLIKALFPNWAKATKITLKTIWFLALVFFAVVLFISDVLIKPEWVPLFTNVR